MKRFIAAVVFLIPTLAKASLINGGFETGDFSGWAVTTELSGGNWFVDGPRHVDAPLCKSDVGGRRKRTRQLVYGC